MRWMRVMVGSSMEVNHTVSLLGFNDKDRTIFTSLLGLLFIRTGESWIVDLEGNGHVVIVDLDSYQSREMIDELRNVKRQVVLYGAFSDKDQYDDVCLPKPLNASRLFACLSQIIERQSLTESAPVPSLELSGPFPVECYQLLAWPDKHVLISFPGASRLSALLIYASVTMTQAAEMTGIPVSEVRAFIQKCEEQGILITHHKSHSPHVVRSASPSEQYLSLFAQLRGRFCCRG